MYITAFISTDLQMSLCQTSS